MVVTVENKKELLEVLQKLEKLNNLTIKVKGTEFEYKVNSHWIDVHNQHTKKLINRIKQTPQSMWAE